MPNVATQTPHGTYCGSKPGKALGSPNDCYKKGLRIGFIGGLHTGVEGAKKTAIAKVKLAQQITPKYTHPQIASLIESKGLTFLKKNLHLDDLKKDEIRSVCTRYTGTPNAIPNYSNMSLQQLKTELRNRGWN